MLVKLRPARAGTRNRRLRDSNVTLLLFALTMSGFQGMTSFLPIVSFEHITIFRPNDTTNYTLSEKQDYE